MAEVKAFRWKGPGVLHIKGRPDGKLIVVPPYEPGVIEHGCIVKDPVNIAALGQDRIASLIAAGQAEIVTWTDQIKGFVREDAKLEESMTLSDVKASEGELQKTVDFEKHVEETTAEIAKTMSPTEKANAEHELKKMGMAATAPVLAGGAIAGGPKAGPDVA